MTNRLAVVLFNLGGPDSPDAVRPFLFNLFNDPAIIRLPGPLRWPLANVIASRRAPLARGIYANLGGKSPLLELTRAQADALQTVLAERGHDVRVFVCMRYWHPRSDAVAREVAAWGPDAVVLLPLYPQFSTTTSASSVADWRRAAKRAGVAAVERTVCCYPKQAGLVAACADLVRTALAEIGGSAPPRVLFSAHGLPKRVVADGDPYQWQVEQTVASVVDALAIADLDHVVCYQSRVGPLEWIGPSTEDEIARAGRDGVAVVVVPIAFVSEHSETLVELDIEYAEKAREAGVPKYVRVRALGTAPSFIAGLADVVDSALATGSGTVPACGARLCPANMRRCPCRSAPA